MVFAVVVVVVTTRAMANGTIQEFGKTDCLKNTFLYDVIKAWNNAPVFNKSPVLNLARAFLL